MKIGILGFVTTRSVDPITLAQKLETCGFESFYLPEHPILPVEHKTPYPMSPDGRIPDPYGQMIDPFVGLALAAAVTKRIRLGTGICLVPERDPLVLAKEVATLDHYSGGRFDFGIGAGWLRDESEIMGVEFKRRWPITREYIRAMKELWTKPQASFEGEFIKFPKVISDPKPVQKPHPPIHVGAGGIGPAMDRALRDTVAIGDGWAPLGVPPAALTVELKKLRQLCAEAGRDFSKLEITMYAPAMEGDAKHTIAAYHEAGVHRLIHVLQDLAPKAWEKQVDDIAHAWL